MKRSWTFAIDRGGTFTDVVAPTGRAMRISALLHQGRRWACLGPRQREGSRSDLSRVFVGNAGMIVLSTVGRRTQHSSARRLRAR